MLLKDLYQDPQHTAKISFWWVVIAFVSMLGHPVGQIIGYLCAMDMGIYRSVETNVTEVPAQFLAFMCILFGLVRFLVFWLFTRGYRPFSRIIKGFGLTNLPGLLGLFTFYLLTQELEGNIVGFFVAPLMIGSVMVLGKWIFYNSIFHIKKLRSSQKPPEEIQFTSNDWSPGKVIPVKNFWVALGQTFKKAVLLIIFMIAMLVIYTLLT
jgi:hypothetical protein